MTKIFNWKTLLIVEWHSEPSLPSCRQRRADAQNRHSRIVLMFVEILSDSSRSLQETSWSQYVPCVHVGTFRQEGSGTLAVLKGEPAESTSCFFVRTELESKHGKRVFCHTIKRIMQGVRRLVIVRYLPLLLLDLVLDLVLVHVLVLDRWPRQRRAGLAPLAGGRGVDLHCCWWEAY